MPKHRSVEMWKPVDGFEGTVEVSNRGRVRTLDAIHECVRRGVPARQFRRGRVLAAHPHSHGYLVVAPKWRGRRKKLLVHRLVGKAFVPGYFAKASINPVLWRTRHKPSDDI